MPSHKLVLEPQGVEALFKLASDDDEPEEGEIDEDDEEEDGPVGSDEEEPDKKAPKAISSDGNGIKNDITINDKLENTRKRRNEISLFEMQSFLVALLLPAPRLSTPPNWCRVIRCMRASNVGIFILDNVDLDWIPNKGSKFSHGFRFDVAPGWIEQLTNVALSRRLRDISGPGGDGYQQDFETNLNAPPVMCKTSLLLSPIQMIAESYPMPTEQGINILRSKFRAVESDSPMFAIDCEMCITNRSELTRLSIVDEELRIVYNELVKPEDPITNYLTRYSGITPEMMEGVTNTIEDVHQALRKILPRDAILCGHSLNSDLSALQIFHPYVIDTSVIFNRTGIRSQKPSLKSLAWEFLGKEIQSVDKLGHDSLEDAMTTMELVKLKLVNGPLFGDLVSYEASQGIKYDHKTGLTHLPIDKFIERHNTTNLTYRAIDTTPGARCIYIHDQQDPLEDEVKEAILQLLDKDKAICVVLTKSGECYVKF